MELTKEILQEAEELGKLFFTEKQIKLILFPNKKTMDLDIVIMRGQLISEAEIRKTVVQQAKAGSAEAQKIVENWKLYIRYEKRR